MAIRYSKLSGEDIIGRGYVRWVKNQLPVAFLRQQILLLALVIASTIMLILTNLFTTDFEYDTFEDLSSDFNYGVIVDCGSSGSRAHIFKWSGDPLVNRVELVRDKSSSKPLSKHITPGLSSLRDEPDRASEYMEPIMTFITDSIPGDKHLDTPVYFLATAGLRLLDDSTQKKILSDITRDFRAKYNFPRIKSQVISGTSEGTYSWLSLNMRTKFQNASSSGKSFGMIEMGGASTQVAFELSSDVSKSILEDLKDKDAIDAFKNEQRLLNLGPGNSVTLFATTFLGLGVNSARSAAIDLMVRDYLLGTNETIKTVDHTKFDIRLQDPCLTSSSSEIVLKPTTLLGDSLSPLGYILKNSDESFQVHLNGTGNFLNCLNLLERVLKIVKIEKLNCPPHPRPCPMALLGSNFIPYQHYPFIGLSEMFFTTHEMMNSSGLFNRSKVLHETQRICGTEYNKLLELYPPNQITYKDRILYECFKASWLLTLLHSSGFRMPVEYDNFRTIEMLDGEEIDWTIGAMVSEIALNRLN